MRKIVIHMNMYINFSFISKRYGDREVACFVYKVKLLQELGASSKGYEVLYSNGADDLAKDAWEPTLDPPATKIKKRLTELGVTEKQFSNLQKNLLPEGVYVEDTAFELPAIGDKVYATGDGGIEGRYLIEPLPGSQKKRDGGYSPISTLFKPGTPSPEIMKDKAGKVIKPKFDPHGAMILDSNNPKRKETILKFVNDNILAGDAPSKATVSLISSDYGMRRAGMHSGIDIAVTPKPTTDTNKWVPIYAPTDGDVIRASFQDEFGRGIPWNNGNHILFQHARNQHFAPGQKSFFLHLIGISEDIRSFLVSESEIGRVSSQANPIPAAHADLNRAPKTLSNREGEERQYTKWQSGIKTRGRFNEQRIDSTNYTSVKTVKKGTLLGWIGNSGKSNGVHLHWQFQNKADPYRYILIYNGKKNQQGNS